MKIQYLIIASLLFFIFCCDKDESNSTDILFNKTWKVGFTDKNPQSNPSGRILYNAWQECEKDDLYSFHTDKGQLVIEKGNDKCIPNGPLTETLSYSIDKDKKVLIIGDAVFTIADLSDSQIKYYAPIPPATNTNYDYLVFILH